MAKFESSPIEWHKCITDDTMAQFCYFYFNIVVGPMDGAIYEYCPTPNTLTIIMDDTMVVVFSDGENGIITRKIGKDGIVHLQPFKNSSMKKTVMDVQKLFYD